MAGVRMPAHVNMIDARLLRVTAMVQQGAALDVRWPLPLDGLLSSVARRARLGFGYGMDVDHHQEGLPLAAWTRGTGAQWFWLASCAVPAGGTEEEVHWWHKRFRGQDAERVCSVLPPTVREGQGRYRSYRMPLPVTVTTRFVWHAVGDPDGVRGLLDGAWAVGKKWGSGEGAVTDWRVDDIGPAASRDEIGTVVTDMGAVRSALFTADGLIARPVPARCAEMVGCRAGCETVQAAIRPPYFRPPMNDDGNRGWRTVIAPWERQAVTTSTPM